MAFADNKPRTVCAPYELTGKITLAAACVAGDQLACSAGWCLSTAATVTATLVALEGGAIGKVISACPIALITSFSGGTAGGDLSNKAAGAYQEGTGKQVGIMISDTSGYVLPVLVPIA